MNSDRIEYPRRKTLVTYHLTKKQFGEIMADMKTELSMGYILKFTVDSDKVGGIEIENNETSNNLNGRK